MGKELVV
jgi:hypothetical protein